ASRSRATSGGISPRCTASCRADRVWERKSVGARSLCSAGTSLPSLARWRTTPQSTTNLVMSRRYRTLARIDSVSPRGSGVPAGRLAGSEPLLVVECCDEELAAVSSVALTERGPEVAGFFRKSPKGPVIVRLGGADQRADRSLRSSKVSYVDDVAT